MLCRALILLLLAFAVFPLPAHADTPPPPIDACNEKLDDGSSFQPWEYSAKVVNCLKGTVVNTVLYMLNELSKYMVKTVGAMFVLAIAFFGIRIIGGEQHLMPKAVSFLIRLGLVLAFSYNLYVFSTSIFGVEDWFIDLVTNHYSPWKQIDGFTGKLFGFGDPNNHVFLYNGLLGIIGAALLSSTTGIVLFIAGLMAVANIIFFILRVVFTYLVAYVVIAILIVISPFVIPTAIFFQTERYFRKWGDLLISAMLVPILMFAFLQLSTGVFVAMVINLFTILGAPCPPPNLAALQSAPYDWSQCDAPTGANNNSYFRAFWKSNQPVFSWLMPSDPALENTLEHVTAPDQKSIPAVQSNMNPLLRRGFNAGIMNAPALNFGAQDIAISQQLVLAFLELWIFASLMKSMIGKIPEISNNIANAVSGIMIIEPSANEAKVKQGLQGLKDKFAGARGAG